MQKILKIAGINRLDKTAFSEEKSLIPSFNVQKHTSFQGQACQIVMADVTEGLGN